MVTVHEVLAYGAMKIHRNVDVPMRDGARLKANVYLPAAPGPHPVVMNFGPYGKDIPLSSYMPAVWELAQQRYPEILASSSCRYVTWEVPDPEVSTWSSPGRSRPGSGSPPIPRTWTSGQVYEVDVSLWPASLHVPAGYRLAITERLPGSWT
jgi:hypothetical protein